VLDEKSIIWYIGQAKNLRSRWAGKSHHRFYQLQKQRKNELTIYYELVAQSELNTVEQKRIEQYNPQLNRTKVKNKKLRPTETLLRETLAIIAPYSFVLGVESPRKEDPKFIEDSTNWRDTWRIQKAVLPLKIIHICVNLKELEKVAEDLPSRSRFLSKVLRKRTNYSSNWECKIKLRFKESGILSVKRLLVNSFAIEVYGTPQETVEQIQEYDLTQLAGVPIRSVNASSLSILKKNCSLKAVGMYMHSDSQSYPYDDFCHQAMERLSVYNQDLIKLLFNEELSTDRLQMFLPERKNIEASDNGLSARLSNLAAKKEYLKALLTERGLNLTRYHVNKYLERIPTNENYIDSQHDRRMTVYVKSFIYGDLRKPIYSSGNIHGAKGHSYQSPNLLHCPYEEVYLASTVDRVFWLLLETYLSDFVKVELNEEEGYVDKAYVSARKILVPAMLTVTINGK
jgi:hypothetical protein